MDRILTAIANNDKVFLKNLAEVYTAYTMEMEGMKDISPSIQQYFSQKQQEFIGMIEGKIDNATANVKTHFKENYKAIETLRNQVGVNPNKDLYNEAGNRFSYVEEKQNNIENKIDVGKGQIHKIEA